MEGRFAFLFSKLAVMKFFISCILFMITFLACRSNFNKEQVQYSAEPLDTVKVFPSQITAKPELFEQAFIKGTRAKAMKSTLDLYGITIGKIKITSGRIVACDPILVAEYGNPFIQIFPAGEFPVQLSLARLGDAATTAFARIYFSDEPVARWEFALLQAQKQTSPGYETDHGYVVDAGLGAFMDVDAKNALLRKGDAFEDELYKELKKHHYKNWKYTMYTTDNYNIACFTTGFGDGHYATYTGFDAKGKPCRLLTDFEIFDWVDN